MAEPTLHRRCWKPEPQRAFGKGHLEHGQARRTESHATHVAHAAGMLSQAAQDEAITPRAGGKRRIVLASPVAESSLTIPGVRVSAPHPRPIYCVAHGCTHAHNGGRKSSILSERSSLSPGKR